MLREVQQEKMTSDKIKVDREVFTYKKRFSILFLTELYMETEGNACDIRYNLWLHMASCASYDAYGSCKFHIDKSHPLSDQIIHMICHQLEHSEVPQQVQHRLSHCKS